MLGINVNFEEKKMCGEKYIKTTKTFWLNFPSTNTYIPFCNNLLSSWFCPIIFYLYISKDRIL